MDHIALLRSGRNSTRYRPRIHGQVWRRPDLPWRNGKHCGIPRLRLASRLYSAQARLDAGLARVHPLAIFPSLIHEASFAAPAKASAVAAPDRGPGRRGDSPLHADPSHDKAFDRSVCRQPCSPNIMDHELGFLVRVHGAFGVRVGRGRVQHPLQSPVPPYHHRATRRSHRGSQPRDGRVYCQRGFLPVSSEPVTDGRNPVHEIVPWSKLSFSSTIARVLSPTAAASAAAAAAVTTHVAEFRQTATRMRHAAYASTATLALIITVVAVDRITADIPQMIVQPLITFLGRILLGLYCWSMSHLRPLMILRRKLPNVDAGTLASTWTVSQPASQVADGENVGRGSSDALAQFKMLDPKIRVVGPP